MPELPHEPAQCHRCHAALAERRVTITELDASTSATSDWVVCSWACARELVNPDDPSGAR